MNWSVRTVNNNLQVERYTVNDIIVNFIKDEFYVNRKYQRKLVWGIDEKRLLIDSMLKGIPLPAVLLVKYDLPREKNNILEVVDGMQRLNAIISFVYGEFGITYEDKICFFDPNANNETFQLLIDGKLEKPSNVLPKDLCIDFCRYQLPAIITGQDDATVEMIFSRINSTGRKISTHDLRQSMATGEFADLVRRVASRVRKDYTYDDRINLSDMPKISVGYSHYGYGVDLDTVFWRRHDLINAFNMKESKDEEIIEALIATVLLNNEFKKSKNNLDRLYENGTELNSKVEQKVIQCGKDLLENKFAKIFDVIDMIFDSVNSNFSSYIFNKKNISNKDECFKILFLTTYRLLDEGYAILDYKSVAVSIKNAKSIFHEFTSTSKVDYAQLQCAKDNLYKLLRPTFSKQIQKCESKMELEIDKRLSYSKIELQMTEFKICISNFKATNFNFECIHDISRTLVAMANMSGVKEEGLVIVGIANDKAAYDNWHQVFKEQPTIINQHFVPGITPEAKKLFGNTDEYYRKLRKALNNEPISEKLKNYILENFEVIDYHDVELLVFRSTNIGEISSYDGIKYVRHSNETVKIS